MAADSVGRERPLPSGEQTGWGKLPQGSYRRIAAIGWLGYPWGRQAAFDAFESFSHCIWRSLAGPRLSGTTNSNATIRIAGMGACVCQPKVSS
jgi:hypothetical protein